MGPDPAIPVKVKPSKTAAVISNDHAISIRHGHNLISSNSNIIIKVLICHDANDDNNDNDHNRCVTEESRASGQTNKQCNAAV